jgi:murein DD-endopeptidase MepM/ murein hydrolase activator NlpD
MRKIVLLVGILLIGILGYAQPIDRVEACKKFNIFNTEVLNGRVKKEEAQKQFRDLIKQINMWITVRNELVENKTSWDFPLRGYNYHAIGGNGDGYSDKGYDYLDGNKHTAHPAHDIFINDKNQDCVDDRTHKAVDVVAVDDGFVAACTNEWESTSNLRGGKFIWVYHPSNKYFTYYAHNQCILVKPGDNVRQGQKIAEVGRTGYNAYKKRSPTHLHFSAFKLVDGLPVPFNPYQQLKKAKTL